MSCKSEWVWLEFITGSRTKTNVFWAFIIVSGSLGFLLVGTSSYLRLSSNLLSLLLSLHRSLFYVDEIFFLPFPAQLRQMQMTKITPPPPPQTPFFPQGLVMSFYGIAGLFMSCYMWYSIFWNVGSGYNLFDRKRGRVLLFRWGFPGKNRRIFVRFRMKDIKSIRIKVTEGFAVRRILGVYAARRALYLEVRGQGAIPLFYNGDNLTARQIEQKAAELADFLCVPIEVF
uniref:Photosystem I assembly protein Ycf4 n=1 Tax=Chorispora tenella TaxID=358662 RepID=A0A6M8YIT0_CHOTE|nr:photosystem I assembly protein Ycf4 [Chorispora tenella]QKK41096.1 photosystem I assembly protein Ycf4 [Chorispora tenella]